MAYHQAHLKIGEEAFLVEAGQLQTEGMHDVVDGDRAVLHAFVCLLRRRVGTCNGPVSDVRS